MLLGEEIVILEEKRWETQARLGGRHGRCEWCVLICDLYGYSAWRTGNSARGRGEVPPVCKPCPIVIVFGKVCTAIPEYQAWKPELRQYGNIYPGGVKITPLGQEASQAILDLIQAHRSELIAATDNFLVMLAQW